jgi:Arc/MetJ-type ribon-helix-helix transcriptional regulator
VALGLSVLLSASPNAMTQSKWEVGVPHKRAHVFLPDDLLAEVDALVGSRGRSAFLAEVIREAVNRRRLLEFLSNPEPVLKDEDYPEFRDGAAAWVRKMRDQDLHLEREKVGDWLKRDE